MTPRATEPLLVPPAGATQLNSEGSCPSRLWLWVLLPAKLWSGPCVQGISCPGSEAGNPPPALHGLASPVCFSCCLSGLTGGDSCQLFVSFLLRHLSEEALLAPWMDGDISVFTASRPVI